MNRFSKQAYINAPAFIIWEVMTDVASWHQWTSTITSIKKLTPHGFEKGTKLLIEQPHLPASTWKVTHVVNEKEFTMVKGNAFLKVTAGHVLHPAANGTSVTLSIEFSGWLAKWVAKKYAGMMNEYLETEAEGLRKECERSAALLYVNR